MLRDVIIKEGVELVVHQTECAHRGVKKFFEGGGPKMAKEKGCLNTETGKPCGPVIFTPIYECALFRLCAPFTSRIDDEYDKTHTCMGCLSRQKPTESMPDPRGITPVSAAH